MKRFAVVNEDRCVSCGAYTAGSSSAWVAQYAFGFYSVMLTSMLLGLVVMALFKPRTWCTFCPMGTMTQMICKMKR
nr:4Fe-4S binding protein [Phascolarctobacterium succinatutens]